jgi:hypothetical protein
VGVRGGRDGGRLGERAAVERGGEDAEATLRALGKTRVAVCGAAAGGDARGSISGRTHAARRLSVVQRAAPQFHGTSLKCCAWVLETTKPIGFERQKTFRPADIRARKRTFDRENDRFERRKTNFAEKIRGTKTPK